MPRLIQAFRVVLYEATYWTVLDENYLPIAPADDYLRHVAFGRGAAESTQETYARRIGHYFRWCSLTGQAWNNPDMTTFHSWLGVGREPDATERTSTASAAAGWRTANSIEQISSTVARMFEHLGAMGLIEPVVLKKLFHIELDVNGYAVTGKRRSVVSANREELSAAKSLTKEQFKLASAGMLNSRDVFIIGFAFDTGLRQGELRGLRLSDLHTRRLSLAVGCEVAGPHVHVRKRNNENRASAKTGNRQVPVTSGVVRLYSMYMSERRRLVGLDTSDFLLVNLYKEPLGRPMSRDSMSRIFSAAAERSGIAMTPHSARHSFATEIVKRTTLTNAQDLLGHKDVRTTQKYVHVDDESLRAAVEQGSFVSGYERSQSGIEDSA